VVVVTATLVRVAKAIIKTRAFKIICIAVPYSIIVICHTIARIIRYHAVAPHTNLPQSNRICFTGILFRATGNFKAKVLVTRYIRVACPRANVVAGYTGAAYIYVGAVELVYLHVRWYAAVTGSTRSVHYP